MSYLFEPITIGNLTLKNRIVFAPTTMGKENIDAYERIAAGGTGLIIIADLSVVPSMLGAPSLDSLKFEEYLKSVIAVCHKHGCKVSAQLFHPEYNVDSIGAMYRNRAANPGLDVRKELAISTEHYCDDLTKEKIEDIIDSFAVSAAHAVQIGFDMIQIHGDRLLGSFTSSIFNHRTDEYKNRTLFSRRVVTAVRAAALQLPLDYKFTIRTEEPALGRGGVLLSETGEFIDTLDSCGIDSYHVSIANHTNLRDTVPPKNHPFLLSEGCFTDMARQVKKYTDKPVCAVGKIQHPEFAEKILESSADMVAMSRQLIADPDWPEKVKNQKAEDIVYCVYCNQQCMKSIMTGQPIGCSLHHTTREEE